MTDDISDLRLFKRLCERETEDEFSAGEISSHVRDVISAVDPILNQVSRSFPEYTLHDPGHGFRVVDNMGKIIPGETLSQLNAVELSILIYAGYSHDIGMAASQQELLNWLESEDFAAFIAEHDNWADALARADRDGDQTARRRLEDMAFTEYLRLRHAERGAQFVVEQFGPDGKSEHRISVREVNYTHLVAQMIASHWEDTASLRHYRRDELLRDKPVNLQYVAVLLRLADLIDLDPERTPKTLLDFMTPQDARSAEEWAKHRSVLGWEITDRRVRFRARCSHPAIQRGLREWMEYIDRERQVCLEIVRDNRPEIVEKYALNLTEPVPVHTIESDESYIYGDFRFELDYERIISLLMGTQLWRDREIALRELLQNAIDSCRHREAASERANLSYLPNIKFIRRTEPDAPDTITCEDNGMGMDQHIINRYFMCIGRSYYQSPEFRQQKLSFEPISQFGLGIMACFMLGDRISVETRSLSPDLRTLGQPLTIDIHGPSRYFVVREGKRTEPGTSTTVFVGQPGLGSRWALPSALAWIAPHPPYNVIVAEQGTELVLEDRPHQIGKSARRLWGGHRFERAEFMVKQAKRYDFNLNRTQTGGLQGAITLLFLRDSAGKLIWFREQGNVTFAVSRGYYFGGNIEYRKWRVTGTGKTRGIEERGVIEVSGRGQTWSQDGIHVRGAFPVPSRHIAMPVPCFLDVDLQGPWKLRLNVTRTEFIADERLDHFKELFYELVAHLLRQVLEAEAMLPVDKRSQDFVDELLQRSDAVLRTHLRTALKYSPARSKERLP